jgi:hypothetical protein
MVALPGIEMPWETYLSPSWPTSLSADQASEAVLPWEVSITNSAAQASFNPQGLLSILQVTHATVFLVASYVKALLERPPSGPNPTLSGTIGQYTVCQAVVLGPIARAAKTATYRAQTSASSTRRSGMDRCRTSSLLALDDKSMVSIMDSLLKRH